MEMLRKVLHWPNALTIGQRRQQQQQQQASTSGSSGHHQHVPTLADLTMQNDDWSMAVDNIRLVVMRERNGEKIVVYDSNRHITLPKYHPVQTTNSHQRKLNKQQTTTNSSKPNNRLQQPFHEPKPSTSTDSRQQQEQDQKRRSAELKEIMELVYGADGVSHRETVKMHCKNEPSQMMLSRVFPVQRNNNISNNNLRTHPVISENSMENITIHQADHLCISPQSTTTTHHAPQSFPMDIPIDKIKVINSNNNNNRYGSLSPDPGAEGSGGGHHGAEGSNSSGGSACSPYTPIGTPLSSSRNFRNYMVQQMGWHKRENRGRLTSSSGSDGDQQVLGGGGGSTSSNGHTGFVSIIGSALIISFNNEPGNESRRNSIREFLLAHMHFVQSDLAKLHCVIGRAFELRLNTTSMRNVIGRAWKEFEISIRRLYSFPRLVTPVWLSLMDTSPLPSVCPTSDSRQTSVAQQTAQQLTSVFSHLVTNYDVKMTNFFISKLLTAVLMHHLTWLSSVVPANTMVTRSSLGNGGRPVGDNGKRNDQNKRKIGEKWVTNHHVTSCAYNPELAQLVEIFGSVKCTKVVLLGKDEHLLVLIQFLLSFFIRCSDLRDDNIPVANQSPSVDDRKISFPSTSVSSSQLNNPARKLSCVTKPTMTPPSRLNGIDRCDSDGATTINCLPSPSSSNAPKLFESSVIGTDSSDCGTPTPTTTTMASHFTVATKHRTIRLPSNESSMSNTSSTGTLVPVGKASDPESDPRAVTPYGNGTDMPDCCPPSPSTSYPVVFDGSFRSNGPNSPSYCVKPCVGHMVQSSPLKSVTTMPTRRMSDSNTNGNNNNSKTTTTTTDVHFTIGPCCGSAPCSSNDLLPSVVDVDNMINEEAKNKVGVLNSPRTQNNKRASSGKSVVGMTSFDGDKNQIAKNSVDSGISDSETVELMEKHLKVSLYSRIFGQAANDIVPNIKAPNGSRNGSTNTTTHPTPTRCFTHNHSLARSMLGAVQNSSMLKPKYYFDPHLVIQGIVTDQFDDVISRSIMEHVKNDFAVSHSPISIPGAQLQADVEKVYIVANTDDWSVKVLNSNLQLQQSKKEQQQQQQHSSNKHNDFGPSQMVVQMIEGFQTCHNLDQSTDFCQMHLEDCLTDIYYKSETMCQLIKNSKSGDIVADDMVRLIGCDLSDIPILLSVASCHTPDLLSSCTIV